MKALYSLNEIEERINEYLLQYENKLINDIPPFTMLDATTEVIGEVIFQQLNAAMRVYNWKVITLEISENPSRTYAIEDSRYSFAGFNPLSKYGGYLPSMEGNNTGAMKQPKESVGMNQPSWTQPAPSMTQPKVDQHILDEIKSMNQRTEDLIKNQQEFIENTVSEKINLILENHRKDEVITQKREIGFKQNVDKRRTHTFRTNN